MNTRSLTDSLCRAIARVTSAVTLGGALLASAGFAGCSKYNDENLWGDSQTPTQLQEDEQAPTAPPYMPDPADGNNQDPYLDNPDYPYANEP